MVLLSGSVECDQLFEAVADLDSPIEAFHRDGQTFLTWLENDNVDGEEYHIYRSTEQITAENLSSAEKLTDRWGPLDDDTSVHRLATSGAPGNFVIQDLGTPLSDDVGLFVYTTQQDDSATAYYAVTTVVNGQEQLQGNTVLSLSGAVTENVGESSAVLVRSVNGGLGQIFTHFMDYARWNPTFQGYAYNYAVALPEGYDASREYPLKLELHAYSEVPEFRQSSEFNWPAIQVYVDDPGGDRGTTHTWWYGFAADHNYQTDGAIPTTGVIENFTEQRVLKAVDEISDRYLVDEDLIHARGHSMGASGALSLGIRYGNVFSGIYASQPMTNYSADTRFQSEFVQLWGSQEDNLLIQNRGSKADLIERYGVDGDRATGVWDWLDHGQQLQRRRGEDIAFLMFGHGKADRVIDWETQGRPFVSAVEAAGVGYSARSEGGLGHGWMGFGSSVQTLFNGIGDWTFDGSQPYLAFSNASSNGDLAPGPAGNDEYNLTMDWSTSWNDFHAPIVDSAERFEVTIRSLDGSQTTNVTPRQLEQFGALAGESVVWANVDNSTGQVIQGGTVVVDSDGLLTVSDFQLGTDLGNRLILTRDSSSDAATPPVEPPVVETPPVAPSEPDEPLDEQIVSEDPSSNEDEQPPAQDPPVDAGLPEEDPVSGDGVGNLPPVDDSPNDVDSVALEGVVVGTDSGEWLSANDASTVFAGAGNDEIHASIGENTIDGGAGFDVLVVYEGTQQDFQIVRLPNGDVIVEGPGIDGQLVRNTLRNVERINFNNGSVLVESLVAEAADDSDVSDNLGSDSVIFGTSDGEWLSGTSGNDQVNSGGGDDELHAPLGENLIDGGAGNDVFVVYEGIREDFDVERFADGRVVLTGPGLNGQMVRNTLVNIERINFNNESLLISLLPMS